MPFSILSLDGGGTWALIQVRILQQRYSAETLGHDILKDYQMVIANSGGSLVLAALCANMPLNKIRTIFEDEKKLKTIFDKKGGIKSWLGFERFSTAKKIIGLRNVLGAPADMPLEDLPAYIGNPGLQIIITGFDYDRERAVFFRSNKLSMMESSNIQDAIAGQKPTNPDFYSITLLNAIHASSNAPILFFDEPAKARYNTPNHPKERLFWDGAIGGNNNPVTAGLLEAMANGVKKEDIQIVSLGTANVVYPVLYGEQGEAGFQHDWLIKKSRIDRDFAEVKKMANAIVSDPPDAATFITHQIMGLEYGQSTPRLIRINPLVKAILNEGNNTWSRPAGALTKEQLKELYDMDMAVTDKENVQLLNKLCDDFFEGHFDNQGIRIGTNKLEPILGHKKFKSALADWNSWKEEAIA